MGCKICLETVGKSREKETTKQNKRKRQKDNLKKLQQRGKPLQ